MNKSPQDEDYSLAQAGQKRPATGEEQRLEIEKLSHSSGDDDDDLLKPAVATDSRDYSFAQTGNKRPTMQDELEKIHLEQELGHASGDEDPYMNKSPQDEDYSLAQAGQKRPATGEEQRLEIEKLSHSSGDDDDDLLKPAVATDSRDYSFAQTGNKRPTMQDE